MILSATGINFNMSENHIHVSIGQRCGAAQSIQAAGKREASFPFDWILTPIESLYQLLHLLIEKNINIETLVREEFLPIDTLIGCGKPNRPPEKYITFKNVGSPHNIKYKISMPHEPSIDKLRRHKAVRECTIEKYIRRFDRLRSTITNTSRPVCFSMQAIGNVYKINGNNTDDPDVSSKCLQKIVDMLLHHNKKNELRIWGNNSRIPIKGYEEHTTRRKVRIITNV